jgi:hypothetical protein
MMTPRHVKNVWKNKPVQPAGKMKSGPPPITVTDIIFVDETCSTDHVGTTVVLTQYALFHGSWDAVYIAANASALGFPWYGDYAEGSDSLVYCSHTEIKWKGGNNSATEPGAFTYTSTFSPITPDRLDLSPLDRPAIVSGGGIELTEVRRDDVNGNPMVNAAGDFYENLPEFYIPGNEFQVSWNVSSNPMTLAKTYSFTTNSTSMWGQDAYSGVVGKISLEETFETYQGILIQYWRITAPFKFRNDGRSWNFEPFNYGYRYKDSTGQPTNYVDPTTGVFGPVFLNADGTLLNGNGSTIGTAPNIFPTGTPDGYETLVGADWTGISVPINPFS